MSEKTEFVVCDDGRFVKRYISEDEIAISETELAKLATSGDKKFANVMMVDDCPAGLCFGTDGIWVTVHKKSLDIRAPYTALSDGSLYPNLGAKNEPVLHMLWIPHPTMNLKLIMHFAPLNAQLPYYCDMMFLVALDSRGVGYKLPIGNLYDDCRVCQGDGNNHGSINLMDAIQKNYGPFKTSIWNADLWKGVEHTQAMFKWKPINSAQGGFEQQPVPDVWAAHCVKVAIQPMQKIV